MAERKYRSEVEWQALNVVNYGVNYNNGDTLLNYYYASE